MSNTTQKAIIKHVKSKLPQGWKLRKSNGVSCYKAYKGLDAQVVFSEAMLLSNYSEMLNEINRLDRMI